MGKLLLNSFVILLCLAYAWCVVHRIKQNIGRGVCRARTSTYRPIANWSAWVMTKTSWRESGGDEAWAQIKLLESNHHSNDFNPIHRRCVIRIFITTSAGSGDDDRTRIYAILLHYTYHLLAFFLLLLLSHWRCAFFPLSFWAVAQPQWKKQM